jgi:hypothetical protein
MIRCGLIESDDAAMARFCGGLNRKIQDILDYKDYFDITILFEYACKAEREVQGRRSRTYTNSFARWGPTHSSTPTSHAPFMPSTTPRTRTTKPAAPSTKGVISSTRLTRYIQCHRCRGFGHMIRDCPNKHTLLIRDNGEYSSASDFEETSHVMIATNHAENEEVHLIPSTLIDMRVLLHNMFSAHSLSRPKKSATHSIPYQGRCERTSIHIIIDSGSCNNMASTALVEKLSLPTRTHPHPYHIQ